MATGQTLLDTMELLNQELQLQSGEVDVTRGLVALNRAQDFYETQAALFPGVHGGASSTVTTSANTETTTFPSGVLRIDGLQFIDPTTSRPAWDLIPVEETGGHAYNNFWPYNLISTTSSGKPWGYWTNGTNIYWTPLPNGTHTVRWYGLQVASDITAGGTFAYPDIVILPVASFAARLMKLGIDDPSVDVGKLATEIFKPVLQTLSSFRRERAKGLQYRYYHDT